MSTTYDGRRLAPGDVDGITFPAAKWRHGYDEEAVDRFCDQVSAELARLLGEKAALAEEVGRLREYTQNPAPVPGDDVAQARRLLIAGQQTVEAKVRETEAYCRTLAEAGRRHRDDILAEARTHASMMLREAESRASQAAAATSSAPLGTAERRDLEGDLAYQKMFSKVYRTHLRAYLEALLRNVDEWENAEHEHPQVAAAQADAAAFAAPEH